MTITITTIIEGVKYTEEYTPTLEDARKWQATDEKFMYVCDTAGCSARQENTVNKIEDEYERLLEEAGEL